MEKYIVSETTVKYYENGSLIWEDSINNMQEIIDHLEECNANYEVVTNFKPKAKLEQVTHTNKDEFNYLTQEYKTTKYRETYLILTFHKSQEYKIHELMNEYDLQLMQCPAEEEDGDIIIYEDAFVQYEPPKYQAFKQALKQLN